MDVETPEELSLLSPGSQATELIRFAPERPLQLEPSRAVMQEQPSMVYEFHDIACCMHEILAHVYNVGCQFHIHQHT